MAKRKLKGIYSRRPKKVVSITQLILQTSQNTEFNSEHVRLVIREFVKLIGDNLIEKNSVNLSGIGLLYPLIRPSRVGVAMNGGEKNPKKMVVPDMFVLKLHPSRKIKKALLELEVTKDELNNLYK